MRVDTIDLWQMYGLTNPAGWETVLGAEGALNAFIEAHQKGLVRFLGVTGLSVKGKEDNVTGSLTGRVRKVILRKAESDRIISNYLYLLNLAVYLKPPSIFSSYPNL